MITWWQVGYMAAQQHRHALLPHDVPQEHLPEALNGYREYQWMTRDASFIPEDLDRLYR